MRLEGEHEGPYPVGPAELFVPEAFVEQARRLLAEIERGSFEVQDEETPPA